MFLEDEVIKTYPSNKGDNIYEASVKRPILLIFLRHFGCTFCREALSDIAAKRVELEEGGTKILFVHMSDNETAEQYFKRYGLEAIEHISDPDCNLYKHFGLLRGSFSQLFGLRVMLRGFEARQHGHAGKMLGDGFQMPGIFLISNGEIKDSYIHKTASDRPDYKKLINCCTV